MLEAAYERMAAAITSAAAKSSRTDADEEADRLGLRKLGDDPRSQQVVWELREGDWSLVYTWRWYDQSRPFSVRPDMNILTVTLADAATVIRTAEERFED